MNTLCGRLGVVVHDIRRGRHIEAYVLFLRGLVLVGPGRSDVVDSRHPPQFTAVAADLAFLVFRTAAPSGFTGSTAHSVDPGAVPR
ncbi:hypothetical protein ACFW9L_22875 [Streptomyces sp. NPDC059517]|uniref:hypothetical protein n=1 Tax=Streptomyces sp. NPDC059517 TaxID=3346855 RepID=UPI00368AB74C